jgi:hypothetical protein
LRKWWAAFGVVDEKAMMIGERAGRRAVGGMVEKEAVEIGGAGERRCWDGCLRRWVGG